MSQNENVKVFVRAKELLPISVQIKILAGRSDLTEIARGTKSCAGHTHFRFQHQEN